MRLVLSGPVSSILPSADGLDHAARAVLLLELRVLGIEVALRLLLGVEVVEVAEELVEAVLGRQMLVAVAEMVLAELAGRIALRLHDVGDGRHPVLDAMRIAGHADRQQAGAERLLAEDERGAAGGAALLAVASVKIAPSLRDAVDVGRAVAHHAHRVGADLGNADVVAEDDEDVRPLSGRRRGLWRLRLRHGGRRSGAERGLLRDDVPSRMLRRFTARSCPSRSVLRLMVPLLSDVSEFRRALWDFVSSGTMFAITAALRR